MTHPLIRTGSDPILKQVCTAIDSGEALPWLDTMERVCRRTGIGVGLAAPQIGYARRVIFTLQRNGMGNLGSFYINPVITWRSEATDVMAEQCLSFPGVTKHIRRATSIRLAFETRRRETHEVTFDGFIARVIQHEIDHLDGICRIGDPLCTGEQPPRVEQERFQRRAPMAAVGIMAAIAMSTLDRRST